MEYNSLKLHLYDMNEDEIFYKKYYFARQQRYSLEKFLSETDKAEVLRRNLLVYEIPESIPEQFLDSWFFDMGDQNSIVVQRHNRYSPALPHRHTFFELSYVYDGSCRHHIAGKDISLRTGDILVVPPNVEHSVAGFDDSLIMFNIMIRSDTIHTVLYNFINTQNILSTFFLDHIYARHADDYILFRTGSDPAIQDAFLRMYWENTNKEKYYYQCIAHTLTLCMFLFIRNYEHSAVLPSFSSKDAFRRYSIIQYVRNHYQDVSLGALSEKFHYSPEYISRLIKETTGMNYTELLLSIRMNEACSRLANTNLTVSAISESLGLKNSEHFIRMFRKHMGMTPTAYRKSQHAG